MTDDAFEQTAGSGVTPGDLEVAERAEGEGPDAALDEADELDEGPDAALDEADELDDEDLEDADDLDELDDMAGNRAEGGTATAVLDYLARALASEPDAVVVEADRARDGTRLRLFVAPEDMGRVIGRRGRTAQAIRTLVAAAGARDGTRAWVDIVDD